MSDPTDVVFFENRPTVMVVSHPRSGTHFLMNSLANCYGYVSNPWLDLDPYHHKPLGGGRFATELETIYYCPQRIADYLLDLARRPLATIVKTHLHADFFVGALEKIVERYVIFVIHRHPAETLRSYWQYLYGIDEWKEGPKPDDVIAFANAEPMGGQMRLQMRQYPTMMHLWAGSVEEWIAAASVSPRIVVVGYDQLKSNFGDLMRSFAPVLGREPQSIAAPDRGATTWIRPHSKEMPAADMAALRALCRETIGATMDRLGYE